MENGQGQLELHGRSNQIMQYKNSIPDHDKLHILSSPESKRISFILADQIAHQDQGKRPEQISLPWPEPYFIGVDESRNPTSCRQQDEHVREFTVAGVGLVVDYYFQLRGLLFLHYAVLTLVGDQQDYIIFGNQWNWQGSQVIANFYFIYITKLSKIQHKMQPDDDATHQQLNMQPYRRVFREIQVPIIKKIQNIVKVPKIVDVIVEAKIAVPQVVEKQVIKFKEVLISDNYQGQQIKCYEEKIVVVQLIAQKLLLIQKKAEKLVIKDQFEQTIKQVQRRIEIPEYTDDPKYAPPDGKPVELIEDKIKIVQTQIQKIKVVPIIEENIVVVYNQIPTFFQVQKIVEKLEIVYNSAGAVPQVKAKVEIVEKIVEVVKLIQIPEEVQIIAFKEVERIINQTAISQLQRIVKVPVYRPDP